MKENLSGTNRMIVVKKLFLLTIPIILLPLGIAGYLASFLGSDPFSVFIDGVHVTTGLTHGQVAMINSTLLITLMFLFGRRYLKIGTIALAVTIGPLIDIFRTALIGMIYSALLHL